METSRLEKFDTSPKEPNSQSFALPPFIISKVKKTTANGTRDFYKGYQLISDYLEQNKGHGSSELRFFFKKAVEINKGEKSSTANQYIRGANREAARLEGKNIHPDIQQDLSNRIAQLIFKKTLLTGKIPSLEKIIQNDALQTINLFSNKRGKLNLGNWGGAAYYQNVKITLNGKTKTILEHIRSDKVALQRYIEVQAAGVVNMVRSGSVDTLSEGWEAFKQGAGHILENGFSPTNDILERATDILSKDKGSTTTPKFDKDEGAQLKNDRVPRAIKSTFDTPKPFEPEAAATGQDNRVRLDTGAIVHPVQTDSSSLAPHQDRNSYEQKPRFNKTHGLTPQHKTQIDLDSIDIEGLNEPSPELIANNPFEKDESGHTHITNEAKFLKRNRKLGLQLIKLAGRDEELAGLFPIEADA